MRLNLYLRGIDLVDLELRLGSKGLYVDLSVFQPREAEQAPDEAEQATTADLTGTSGGNYERAEGPVWDQDQAAVVRVPVGFGRSAQC